MLLQPATQHLWSYCLEDVIAPRRHLVDHQEIQNTFTCYDIVCLSSIPPPLVLHSMDKHVVYLSSALLLKPCGSIRLADILFSSNWMAPCKNKSSGIQMCVHLVVSFFACKKSSSQGLLGCPAKIHKRLAHGACSSLVFTFCSLASSWIAAPSQTRSLFESSCCVPSHQWISLLCKDFPLILHTHIGWATAPPLLFILPIIFPIHLAVSFAHTVRSSFLCASSPTPSLSTILKISCCVPK